MSREGLCHLSTNSVDFWNQAIESLPDTVAPEFVREFQRSTVSEPLSPEFFETVVAESQRLPGWLWRDAVRGFLTTDFTAGVGEIRAPTRIIWGDRDRFSSQADQDSLMARIRGARLVAYTGIGHAANWEVPARFAADLVAFIDGQTDGRTDGL